MKSRTNHNLIKQYVVLISLSDSYTKKIYITFIHDDIHTAHDIKQTCKTESFI